MERLVWCTQMECVGKEIFFFKQEKKQEEFHPLAELYGPSKTKRAT